MQRGSVRNQYGDSVSVAELLRRPSSERPSSERPDNERPSSEHEPPPTNERPVRADVDAAGNRLMPAGAIITGGEPILCPDRPDVRTGALVTVLTLFAALLCGATAAISAIITNPFDRNTLVRPPRPPSIEGSAALRPDLLLQARWPFTATPGAPSTTPRTTEAFTPGTPAQESPQDLVRRFCTGLGTDPGRAVRLLSPELAGDPAIAQAWRPAISVHAGKPLPLSANSAETEITAEFANGKRITVREEFHVSSDDRISAVRLLGASVQG